MVLYYFIILMRHFGTILFTFQDYASQLKPVNRQSFVYGVLTLCSYRRPADLLIVTRNQLQWECRRDKFEAIHFVSYLLTIISKEISLKKYMLPCQWLVVPMMVTSCMEGSRRFLTAHDFTSSDLALLFYFRCYRRFYRDFQSQRASQLFPVGAVPPPRTIQALRSRGIVQPC